MLLDDETQSFSATVGLLYVFNAMVGTGALTLPHAFSAAGYALGTALLLVSAFTSYVSFTFLLESMAIANFVLRRDQTRQNPIALEFATDGGRSGTDTDHSPPPAMRFVAPIHSNVVRQRTDASEFEITKRLEVSEMAHMFCGRTGALFAYTVLIVYAFGSQTVYCSCAPKSLMNMVCSALPNDSVSADRVPHLPCRVQPQSPLHSLSRLAVYRLSVLFFCALSIPMVVVGMARIKWIQVGTTLFRWAAFSLMIVLALISIKHKGVKGRPAAADFSGFGPLFGVAVYTFMCQHSAPGLITPIRSKCGLNLKLSGIYALIFLFYVALSLSGSFAFVHVEDVYTVNFLHVSPVLDYLLGLFPMLVISSNIILAITLCNNIRALFTLASGGRAAQGGGEARYFKMLSKYGIPVCVVGIPTCVSLLLDDVTLIASFTGSFPGVGVQFVLPVLLLVGARRAISAPVPRQARSPFSHWAWPPAILCWASLALLVVLGNHFFRT